jgi:hypothetical protein
MKKYMSMVVVLIMAFAINIYSQDTTGTGSGGTGSDGMGTTRPDTTNGVGSQGGNNDGMQNNQQSNTGASNMQNEDETFNSNADKWSQSLSDELSLNTTQRDSVRSILLDYQRQRSALSSQSMDDTQLTQFNSTFNDRINGLLNGDQVNSYNSFNKGWWNEINSSITNTGTNGSSDDQQQ